VSVVMTLRVAADPARVEKFANENAELMQTIGDRARSGGCISHAFYGGDGQILVLDEWESAEAFQSFFDGSPEIPEMMGSVGVTSEPEVSFWQKLDTKDDF
jgi:quinol monooxygenase YgiN